MNCPRCNEPTETGAAYCGNCGQALQTIQSATQTPRASQAATSAAAPTMPNYALSTPAQHVGETKALLSLILGIIGIPASFIPGVGFLAGITGLILGTLSRKS